MLSKIANSDSSNGYGSRVGNSTGCLLLGMWEKESELKCHWQSYGKLVYMLTETRSPHINENYPFDKWAP